MKYRDDVITSLDTCIKCSACTAQCPVSKVNPNFGGPKWLGPDAERLRLESSAILKLALDDCSNCKTCESTCPSGVKITDMILKARRKRSLDQNTPTLALKMRLRGYVLGRAEYLGRLGVIWPGLTNKVLGLKIMRYGLDKALGISKFGPLPPYSQALGIRADQAKDGQNRKLERKVMYFPGCYTNYNEPNTGRMVIKILEHVGYKVVVPDFHCCGLPLEANGQFAKAQVNATHNLELMENYLQVNVPIITSCTSCGLTLKEEYPKVSVPGAERIGQQTFDLFEFLWSLHEKNELPLNFIKQEISLGYHLPCHLRAQGIGIPSLRVLSLIPGINVHNLDVGCCGLSGSYGFKKEKYEISMQIGRGLFEATKIGVNHGDFQEMITECGVCKVQIEHGAGVPTKHPVWILAQAYGLA